MKINETIQNVHSNAKNKGFWDEKRNVGELLMLITSELGEALEAHKKNKFFDNNKKEIITSTYIKSNDIDNPTTPEAFKILFQENVKDTFEDEIADTVIRLFDLAGGLNIDLEWHIKTKMNYNKTRERLHGKAY